MVTSEDTSLLAAETSNMIDVTFVQDSHSNKDGMSIAHL